MTALRKKGGRVRGIVVGDVIRTLTARTIAKQLGRRVEEASAPFQYALLSRHGQDVKWFMCCKPSQSWIQRPPSRRLTVDRVVGGSVVLPFARLFYHPLLHSSGKMKMVRCAPSTRRRARGCSHVAALEAIQRGLSPDEKLLAFLDDLCTVSKPQRVGILCSVAQRELWAHCRIHRAGHKPEACNR